MEVDPHHGKHDVTWYYLDFVLVTACVIAFAFLVYIAVTA